MFSIGTETDAAGGLLTVVYEIRLRQDYAGQVKLAEKKR